MGSKSIAVTRLVGPVVAAALAFVVAFAACRSYQQHSEPVIEIQADAAKYLTAAFNLYTHGAHSLDPPSTARAPRTRTDLAAGYPVFLSLFFTTPPDSRTLLPRVRLAQALLAAGSAAVVVLLGALAMPLWAALAAGMLTAITPQLMALSAAMLSETLFVFLLCLGVLVFTAGWLRAQRLLLFLGVVTVGLAAEVRSIGVVLPLVLTLACLLTPQGDAGRTMWRRVVMLLVCTLAVVLVLGLHQLFMSRYGTTEAGERAPAEYQRVDGPVKLLLNSARPPTYLVVGESYILAENGDGSWRDRTEATLMEEPLAYLTWNLWERWRVMLAFGSAYTGTAEPYPMNRSAFDQRTAVATTHTLMQALHWPLTLLAIAGTAAILVARAYALPLAPATADALLPAALAIGGLFLALAAIDWLPRYTVPLRPLSYLMLMAALLWLRGAIARRKAAGGG